MKYSITLTCLLLLTCNAFTQNKLPFAPNINLSRDSARNQKIAKTLAELLQTLDARDDHNQLIDNRHKAQTLDLLDEFKGVRKNPAEHNDTFYSPSIGNIVKQDDSTSLVQIIYAGISKGLPVTRAVFNLVAHIPASGHITFSSPIAYNTSHWKQTRIGNVNFHHQEKLNTSKAKELVSYMTRYDAKLSHTGGTTEYYCCENVPEVLYILGIAYESDYAGRRSLALSSSYGNISAIVSCEGGDGYSGFDPHDLWHARLRLAVGSTPVNRPVDEGCAYLYGGSWGVSWKEIYRQFLDKYSKDTSTNWLDLYGKFQNFGQSESEPIYAGYVINALIVNKLEKEQGFAAVKELLACGKYEKSNDNYFAALNKLLGINRENFNREVWKLIRSYRIS